jgi:hypothetical protein
MDIRLSSKDRRNEQMLKQSFLFACVATAIATAFGAQTQPAVQNSSDAPQRTAASSMASINNAVPITAGVTLSIVNADGTERDQQGHYYRSHDGKVREDLGSGSVITDKAAGTITTLNPTTKQAIVTPTPGPKGRYVQRDSIPATPEVSVIGQATVEGHPVDMRRITLASSNGLTTEVWTATDIRLTVLLKATAQSGRITTRRYQNIQSLEPDPSLFTIPQDYTIIRKASINTSTSTSMQ